VQYLNNFFPIFKSGSHWFMIVTSETSRDKVTSQDSIFTVLVLFQDLDGSQYPDN